MRPPRFTIAGLMVLTLFVGVAVAALRSASDEWASVLFTLTIVMLAIAVLGALFRQGQRRAFWTGFALFGWGYLLVCFGHWFATEVNPHLVTTKLLERVYPRLAKNPRDAPYDAVVNTYSMNLDAVVVSTNVARVPIALDVTQSQAPQQPRQLTIALAVATPEAFLRVGHSLLALVFAYLGALVARYFSKSIERETPESLPHQAQRL